MMHSRRAHPVVALAALLAAAPPILTACSGGTTAEAESAAAEPIPVRTLRVSPEDVSDPAGGLVATGTLEADRHAVVAFAVSGVIAGIRADAGDVVRRGDLLAWLDPVPFESALDQAEARAELLGARRERTKSVHEAAAASDDELDAVSAEARAAAAGRELAAWSLTQSRLTAPFSGRVLARHVEPGETAGPAAPAFELLAVDTLRLTVGVPARDVARLLPPREVTVRLSERPEVTGTAGLDHAPVASDPRSGTVPLTFKVPNRDGSFLPGLLAEIVLPAAPAAEGAPAVTLPLSALRMTREGATVFRLRDGTVERVAVSLGEIRTDRVVVLAGLAAGDRVVNEPPDRLRPGDAVVVVDDAAQAE